MIVQLIRRRIDSSILYSVSSGDVFSLVAGPCDGWSHWFTYRYIIGSCEKKKQETVASIQCDSAPLFVDVDIGILPPFAVSLI